MDKIVQAVRLAIIAVSTAVWAVVGLFFWIPLLCRAVAVFLVQLIYCTVTESDYRPLKRPLDYAIRFYFQGFEMIFSTLKEGPESAPAGLSGAGRGTGDPQARVEKARRLLWELGWSLIFWGCVIALVLLREPIGKVLLGA